MKEFTKAELIDFRERLVKARDRELRLSGNEEGMSFVCGALSRYDILCPKNVHDFVCISPPRKRNEIAALFANSLADRDRRIKEAK